MRERELSTAELYIMTDAEGFTTAIEVSMNNSPRDNEAAMLKEFGRRPMIAPITCYHWRKTGAFQYVEWRLVNTWGWEPHRGA